MVFSCDSFFTGQGVQTLPSLSSPQTSFCYSVFPLRAGLQNTAFQVRFDQLGEGGPLSHLFWTLASIKVALGTDI